MKFFAIRNAENNPLVPIGYLFCYEKANAYIVELPEHLNEWDAPFLFQKNVREKKFTVPHDIAALWVEERIIPSGRQNISSILKNANLKVYNELALLALSKGKCSQDSCYIEEITYNDIPSDIRKRSQKNVEECYPSEPGTIVCLFRDKKVRKISLFSLETVHKELAHVLRNDVLFRSVKPGIGGYSITFDNAIDIPAGSLRDRQYELPLSADDFYNFTSCNVINTTKVCELLECSRQNIAYLIKTGKLTPIVTGNNENLFTRGNVEKVLTE